MSNNVMYGGQFVSDTDESLQSKSYSSFGLNQDARIKKFSFENAAKENEPVRNVICIDVDVKGSTFKDWINPIDKIKKGDVDLVPGTDDYNKEAKILLGQMYGAITHYLKAMGVPEGAIQNVLSQAYPSYEAFATAVCALVVPNYSSIPVDVFLEYQWTIGKDKDKKLRDKTYPTLPKNLKGGYFIVPAQPGVFVPVTTPEGELTYVNAQGNLHPFKRSKDFMESKKGTQQTLASASASNSAFQAPAASSFGAPNPAQAFGAPGVPADTTTPSNNWNQGATPTN